MSQVWYYPAFADRERFSANHAPSPRDWYSLPLPQWHSSKDSPYPRNRRPKVYKGPATQWPQKSGQSPPNQWQTWGSSPGNRQSFQYSQRTYNGPFDLKRQHLPQDSAKHRRNAVRDISHYYKPSMMEDPWSELVAEAAQKNPHQPQLSQENPDKVQ